MIAAQPSRSAERVALRRAAHQLYDAHPLVFQDPLALQILSPELRRQVERTPRDPRKRPYSASSRAFVVARARFTEDVLAGSVDRLGTTQYLVLGAGLDTFAYRNPHPHLRVFEVDHPATQAWKRGLLEPASIAVPNNGTFVPLDFEHETLQHALEQAGFSFAQPTIVAWLGVVPYLAPEAFRATLRVLGQLPPGSELVFDYSYPRHALPPVEQRMLDSISSRVAQTGEPFRLFFTRKDLADELAAAGFVLEENLGSAQLNALYFDARTDGLHVRGHTAHLCHAKRIEPTRIAAASMEAGRLAPPAAPQENHRS